jgi:hypothetical protein
MNWVVGKTYKTKNAGSRTVVAIAPDGRLIVASGDCLSYRNPDGTYWVGGKDSSCDLINDAPTEAERKLLVSIGVALGARQNDAVIVDILRSAYGRTL